MNSAVCFCCVMEMEWCILPHCYRLQSITRTLITIGPILRVLLLTWLLIAVTQQVITPPEPFCSPYYLQIITRQYRNELTIAFWWMAQLISCMNGIWDTMKCFVLVLLCFWLKVFGVWIVYLVREFLLSWSGLPTPDVAGLEIVWEPERLILSQSFWTCSVQFVGRIRWTSVGHSVLSQWVRVINWKHYAKGCTQFPWFQVCETQTFYISSCAAVTLIVAKDNSSPDMAHQQRCVLPKVFFLPWLSLHEFVSGI